MTREGDLISRQATIEAFQMFRGYEANRTNAEWVDRIETIVKKLPSVKQEPNKEAYNQGYEDGYLAGQKNIAERFEDLIKSGISTDTPDDIEYVIGLLNKLPPINPQPCKDAISRQDAIRICEERGHDNSAYCMRQLPPVNPQEKTGHWIEKYTEDDCGELYSYWACSECGRSVGFNLANIEDVLNDYPYCHCGARMVEPQESEDKE